MTKTEPRLIVVEGPIGVGKTTLAQRLATDFKANLMLERADQNPFLERFYSYPRQFALHTQLHFLLTRVAAIREIQTAQPAPTGWVTDFLLAKDRLFAENALDEQEFELYEQVWRNIDHATPTPDLVVYLQAPVEVLLKRVARRGRNFERGISPAYLERLNDAYASFFHYYHEAPLLIVNATEIDFANNDRDYRQLLNQIVSIKRGRNYFNPLPADD
ncbi:MAG: deoxynucleoside kinase [Thiotrichales bacterium]